MNEINDIRLPKEFNGITFSNFKKSEVRKELLNSINNNKIENACHWSAELICAGHFGDLWEIIIYNIGKNIHLANPKIPIYVDMRFQNFKEIVKNGYIGNELAMRNNDKIRSIFCELITILCLSNKKPAFECVKIAKEEFNLLNLTNKFKAPNTSYALKVFDKNDPKEIYIPLNELIYNLTKKDSNLLECCYWIEWIVEFDNICRKKKETLNASRRTFAAVDPKFQLNVIWIIWDVFLNLCEEKGGHYEFGRNLRGPNLEGFPPDSITRQVYDSDWMRYLYSHYTGQNQGYCSAIYATYDYKSNEGLARNGWLHFDRSNCLKFFIFTNFFYISIIISSSIS